MKDNVRISSGKIIDSKNDRFIIHIADKDIKAIRFNPIYMNGEVCSRQNEICSTDVIGFRKWNSPFEVNIKITDKGSNKYGNQVYDINFYGCVVFCEKDIDQDKLNIVINDKEITFKFSENNLYISKYKDIKLQKTNKKNHLDFNDQIINLGLEEPIKRLCFNDSDYGDKINSDVQYLL